MSNSLMMSYKRILRRNTTYITLILFLLVFILDHFVLRNTFAYFEGQYQFPHALEVFILRHDSMVSIMPIFLPFFVTGIIGDDLLTDKLSGIDNLVSIRSSRWTYLAKKLLHSSIVIGSLIAVVYILLLLASFIIYPLNISTVMNNSIVQDSNFQNPIPPLLYALLLILTNSLVAIGFNLTAQAIGLITNRKSTYYIALLLVIFVIPYVLYFGVGPRVLPISRYMPFIVLNEALTLPIGIFMIMVYWIGHITLNLLLIYIVYSIQQKQLQKGVL